MCEDASTLLELGQFRPLLHLHPKRNAVAMEHWRLGKAHRRHRNIAADCKQASKWRLDPLFHGSRLLRRIFAIPRQHVETKLSVEDLLLQFDGKRADRWSAAAVRGCPLAHAHWRARTPESRNAAPAPAIAKDKRKRCSCRMRKHVNTAHHFSRIHHWRAKPRFGYISSSAYVRSINVGFSPARSYAFRVESGVPAQKMTSESTRRSVSIGVITAGSTEFLGERKLILRADQLQSTPKAVLR